MTLEEALKMPNVKYVRRDGDQIEVTFSVHREPDRVYRFDRLDYDAPAVTEYLRQHPQPLRSPPALRSPRALQPLRQLGSAKAHEDRGE